MKLTNNWFGERERGFANGICNMAVPVGILVCKILIQTIMWDDDKLPKNSHRGRLHYDFFLDSPYSYHRFDVSTINLLDLRKPSYTSL